MQTIITVQSVLTCKFARKHARKLARQPARKHARKLARKLSRKRARVNPGLFLATEFILGQLGNSLLAVNVHIFPNVERNNGQLSDDGHPPRHEMHLGGDEIDGGYEAKAQVKLKTVGRRSYTRLHQLRLSGQKT